MIPVTKPYLPDLQKYHEYVDGIYNRNWLTNNGPLVNEFELKLKEHLGLDHLLLVSNGTIAIQLAIKALDISGEIITTPFSYIATTSSIVWEGRKPVFVDIDKKSLNIDASKIEKTITPETSAILATHCFGNVCDIDAIDDIAKKHDLKVIYDGAHCFGTKYKNKSVFAYGDICTTSLHATKIMHSVEGGLVVTKMPNLLRKMAFMRNFGHNGPEKYEGVGINAKNSEFHAAMGLSVLSDIEDILEKRQIQCSRYDEFLKGLNVQKPQIANNCDFNNAYYPIVFRDLESLIRSKDELEKHEIFPRRYFYPSLSELDYVDSIKMPICDDISSKILCLPLYHDLDEEEQKLIARILLRVQNN
ncbi:MAG: DegT/DnrJ/EryC1/StrS family aminotransferase [Bacteroidota bacterium]